MRRSTVLLGLLVGATSLAMVGEREAAACGGVFVPQPVQVTDTAVTDQRMLLSVSQTQTTLYDQVEYSGNPSSFAWVLPIHGTVTIGLSADVVFDTLDTLTATQVTAPTPDCPPPPNCEGSGEGEFNSAEGTAAPTASNGGGAKGGSGGPPPVTVTQQENVGPYATVQLHSTSPTALNDWLTTNGFDIPSDVQTTIAAYVGQGFDFLAMKLLPNAGVQAMRPVRVSMPGAALTLPLRMASVGTGSTTGITVWIVSEGRYDLQNFPTFRIDDSQLVWDWSTNTSNYLTLRAAQEQSLGGKGWEVESSIDLAQQTISSVIQAGGLYNPDGAPVAPVDASQNYIAGTSASGATETPDQVRQDDLSALFAGISGPNARITRVRSDIAHAAMSASDLLVGAATDQTELSNVRNVTQQINLTCPIYGNDCSVVGYGTPAQAQASVTAGSGGGGMACNTSSRVPASAPVGLGAAAALLGLVMVRARRRR